MIGLPLGGKGVKDRTLFGTKAFKKYSSSSLLDFSDPKTNTKLARVAAGSGSLLTGPKKSFHPS